MSDQLNELFATSDKQPSASTRSLEGTERLTSIATGIANEIIAKANSDINEYRDMIAASKENHGDMDKLIFAINDLSTTDVEFIKALSDDTIEGILKSQQSKRSRAKSNTMTLDNYTNMLTAAVAENLVRLATGKTKSSVAMNRREGTEPYTTEELEELKANPERLRASIRNVQSKKSIAKSKSIAEDTEYWQALLVLENQLKTLRGDTVATVIEVDRTKDKLAELLTDVNIAELKGANSKELLAKVQELLK